MYLFRYCFQGQAMTKTRTEKLQQTYFSPRSIESEESRAVLAPVGHDGRRYATIYNLQIYN